MADSQSVVNIGTFVSALLGASIGVFMDRVLRRVESLPLFRILLGEFVTINVGRGISLTVENVGLNPIPQYTIRLFHPDRGSLDVFNDDREKLVFPQYPQQQNTFQCVTQPDPGAPSAQEGIRHWLHRVRDKQVAAPHFAAFALRLVLENSDQILFEDEGLGNSIAQQMYERVTGKVTEQKVERIYYRSKAPFWVEMVRRYRNRKMIRSVKKEK